MCMILLTRYHDRCSRLNLTAVCYLWQRDQSELLSEMIENGMKCILVKVAAMGLKVQNLGKGLSTMHAHFEKMHTLCGLHVCGEGNVSCCSFIILRRRV